MLSVKVNMLMFKFLLMSSWGVAPQIYKFIYKKPFNKIKINY